MKKISSLLILILLIGINTSFAQEEKRASPAKEAEGNIGQAEIEIEYSSPSVKGRKIYGGLEAYNEVWRAGANEATTFETDKDLTINGKTLEKGRYSLFIIPQKKGDWTVIFNKVSKQWGAYKYDQSQDALRVEAKAEKIPNVESLSYTILEEGKVYMEWSDRRVILNVKEK